MGYGVTGNTVDSESTILGSNPGAPAVVQLKEKGLMSREERFLNRAAGVALTSKHRWKLGAVITKGSKVASFSCNTFRNSPDIDPDNSTYHAEENALRHLCYLTGKTYEQGLFRGYTIYVARVNKLGETRLARPCGRCWKALVNHGIRDVWYTNELGGYSHETVN